MKYTKRRVREWQRERGEGRSDVDGRRKAKERREGERGTWVRGKGWKEGGRE